MQGYECAMPTSNIVQLEGNTKLTRTKCAILQVGAVRWFWEDSMTEMEQIKTITKIVQLKDKDKLIYNIVELFS